MIATYHAEGDKQIASRAGADEVLLTGDKLVERIRVLAPNGINHIVEVAFGANIKKETRTYWRRVVPLRLTLPIAQCRRLRCGSLFS